MAAVTSKLSENSKIVFLVDKHYEDDTTIGVVLSGKYGEYLNGILTTKQFRLNKDITYMELKNNQDLIKTHMREKKPNVVVCMGKKAWRFMTRENCEDLCTFEDAKRNEKPVVVSSGTWCIAIEDVAVVLAMQNRGTEIAGEARRVIEWKSRIGNLKSYAKKSACAPLKEYVFAHKTIHYQNGEWGYEKIQTAMNEMNTLSARIEAAYQSTPDTISMMPVNTVFNASKNEMWFVGTSYGTYETVCAEIVGFEFRTCVECPDNLNDLSILCKYLEPEIDKHSKNKTENVRLERGKIRDINDIEPVHVISLHCDNTILLTHFAKLTITWLIQTFPLSEKNPRTFGLDKKCSPLTQFNCVFGKAFQAVTRFEPIDGTSNQCYSDIVIKATPNDFPCSPRSIEGEVAHRAVYIDVIYGGNTYDKSGYQIYGFSFGGEKVETYCVGFNSITTEKQLIQLFFDRLAAIKSLLLIGYNVRQDLFLVFDRAIYLEMPVDKLMRSMSLFPFKCAQKNPFYLTSSQPAFPTEVRLNIESVYRSKYFQGILFIDVCDVANRFACPESAFDKVFGTNLYRYSHSKNRELARLNVSKWFKKMADISSKKVKLLFAYMRTNNVFSKLSHLSYITYFRYNISTLLDLSIGELANATFDVNRMPSDSANIDGMLLRKLNYVSRSSALYTKSGDDRSRARSDFYEKDANKSEPSIFDIIQHPKSTGRIATPNETMLVFKMPNLIYQQAKSEKKSPYLYSIDLILVDLGKPGITKTRKFGYKYILAILYQTVQIMDPDIVSRANVTLKNKINCVPENYVCSVDLFGRIICIVPTFADTIADVTMKMADNGATLKYTLKRGVTWGSSGAYIGLIEGNVFLKCSNVLERECANKFLTNYMLDGNVKGVKKYFNKCVLEYDGPCIASRLCNVPVKKNYEKEFTTIASIAESENLYTGDTVHYCVDKEKGVVHARDVGVIVPNVELYTWKFFKSPIAPLIKTFGIHIRRTALLNNNAQKSNSSSTKCLKCDVPSNDPLCNDCSISISDIEDLCIQVEAIVVEQTDMLNNAITTCRDCSGDANMTFSTFNCAAYSCPTYEKVVLSARNLSLSEKHETFMHDFHTQHDNKKRRA